MLQATLARPSNSAQRRGEIADAFVSVVAKNGYHRATIAAIAKKSGLRSGLVHYHFGSKEDIMLLAIERMTARLAERADALRGKVSGDPLAELHALVDAHLALGPGADPDAVAAWVSIGAEALAQPRVRRAYAAALAQTAAQIHTLVSASLRQERGTARDARAITAAILSAIQGAYHLSATTPDLLPRGFAAPSLRKMIRGLVQGRA